MTIDQLWDNALDYHFRFQLLLLAGYSKYSIMRLRNFFCQWDNLDFRIQQKLERASWDGKYKYLKRKPVSA